MGDQVSTKPTTSFYGTWGYHIGGGIPRDDPDVIHVPGNHIVTLRLTEGERIRIVTTGRVVK